MGATPRGSTELQFFLRKLVADKNAFTLQMIDQRTWRFQSRMFFSHSVAVAMPQAAKREQH